MFHKTRRPNPTKTKKNCFLSTDDMYVELEGIKILIGCTIENYEIHTNMIDVYSNIIPVNLLDRLEFSTIAAISKIKNLKFYEETVFESLKFTPQILSVSGLGKKVFNPEIYPDRQPIKCNTFNFQITAEVATDGDKSYKIKVFRNGTLHIPGITRSDMADIIQPLRHICTFLKLTLEKDIEIDFIKATMRNFSCVVKNSDLGIKITTLIKCMMYERSLKMITPYQFTTLHDKILNRIGQRQTFIFLKFIKWNPMPIQTPKRNVQKTSGVLIKFNRYSDPRTKDLTIRILTSGKITFNGSNSDVETLSSYHWLNFIVAKYYDEIIYDPVRNETKIVGSFGDIKFEEA
jgi:hypothetical protein